MEEGKVVFLKFQVVRKGLSDEVTFELRPERCVKRRVADCNKCTTLVQDVDSGRGSVYVGASRYKGNLCTFHSIWL